MSEKEELKRVKEMAEARAVDVSLDDLERSCWSNIIHPLEILISYLELKEAE